MLNKYALIYWKNSCISFLVPLIVVVRPIDLKKLFYLLKKAHENIVS